MKGNKEIGTMCRKGVKATGKIGKRKRVLFMMTVMLITLSFSGCGSKKKEARATVAEESETTLEEGTGFDFSQVFDKIEINGKPVSFPFAVSDLGDEYTIDYVNDIGNGMFGASLLHDGLIIASLYYSGDKKEEINRDKMCYDFQIGDMGQDIYINGINCKSSLNEVKQQFPDLAEIFSENGTIIGSEIRNKDNIFSISYRDDLSISFIHIKVSS